jgi:hypothetical protein
VGCVSNGPLLASALPKYLAAMEDLSFIKESGDACVHYLVESADRPVSEVMSTEVLLVELGNSEAAVAHKMVTTEPPASWSLRTASSPVSLTAWISTPPSWASMSSSSAPALDVR